MSDDAIIVRSRLKYLIQSGQDSAFGNRTHPRVPLGAITARQSINDVYLAPEIAQLMNPSLMAVQCKKSLQTLHFVMELSNIHAIFQLLSITWLSIFAGSER